MLEGHAFSAVRPQTSLKSNSIILMMFHKTGRGREISLTGITALSTVFSSSGDTGRGALDTYCRLLSDCWVVVR